MSYLPIPPVKNVLLLSAANLIAPFSAITVAPVTLSAWFFRETLYKGSSPQPQTIISLRSAGGINSRDRFSLGFTLISGTGFQLEAVTSTTSSSASVHPKSYIPGTWAHGVAVFASSTSRNVYLNGVPGTVETTSKIPSGVNRISIGGSAGSTTSQLFPGAIAEAAIWNVALSDAEINLLYGGVPPINIQRTALMGYWPLGMEGLGPTEDFLRLNRLSINVLGSMGFMAGPRSRFQTAA